MTGGPRYGLMLIVMVAMTSCEPSAKIKTPIPETNLEIHLHGPDSKNHFRYSVIENGAVVAERFLGPAYLPPSTTARLSLDGRGAVRVTWGEDSASPFTVIDVKNRLIIEDINRANPLRQPFAPRR